ncbi:TetR/AcrR family transcriptional regulator [uncultured Stenotrophomonas sp.]|uniref:TetR/AcrR family transcriptional regulator n=1 Tax=uncultured Stenotrophomonas sp. TaxID=165438 RepID=UPI0025EF28D8|nr:TetR/AcrR family transcriptional regulator [uncultured Stenotrophomonas sp.]
MTTRSPAVERICDAAVIHFAERGYDGSSLNEIAEAVDIRKASLYAHFSGKDALFLEVYADALVQEMQFAQQCFADERTTAQPGSLYCERLAKRYLQSQHLRFLLRTAYIPPQALVEQIDEGYIRYLATLSDNFEHKLLQSHAVDGRISKADIALYGNAYLAIVDSLHVKLIYTNGRQVNDRLKAMQRLLSDSLQATAGP